MTIPRRVAFVVLMMFLTLCTLRAQENNSGKSRQGALALNGIPRTISYQGSLTQQGVTATGDHQLIITLYTDSNGQDSIWRDTFTVTLTGGVFSVLLGSGLVPLPASPIMDRPLWLGVTVDGSAELSLTPLASVPYALNVADNSITSDKIAAGTITADKLSPSILTGLRESILPSTAGKDGQFLEIWPGGQIGWGSLPFGNVSWTGNGTVTKVNGSGGTTGLTLRGGPITDSGTLTLGGTLAVSNGGTGQTSLTNHGVLIGAGASGIRWATAGTGGQVLTSNGPSADPTWQSPAASGTVTSVTGSGGLTGLTLTGGPITTSGTLTLAGTLAVSNGGTGQTTAAGALKALLPDSAGGATKVLAIKPGGGIGWTDNGATVTNTMSAPIFLDANASNYPIDPGTTYLRLASSAGGIIELSGLGSTGVANGRVITIANIGGYAIVIKHQGASAEGNQFDLPGGSDIILAHGGSATFIYDRVTQTPGFWELVSTN